MKVAKASNDLISIEYYNKLELHIRKPYRNIKRKELSAIWDLADVGETMCNQMLADNTKNYLTPKIQEALNEYLEVKRIIEDTATAYSPKKFKEKKEGENV